MSIYSHVLRDVGGFDPQFKHIALREEADVAERLKRKGGKIFYQPSAFVIHLKASSGGCRHKDKRYEIYWAKRCDSMFLLKNFSRLTWFVFLSGNVLFYLLFRVSSLKPVLTGILDGLNVDKEPSLHLGEEQRAGERGGKGAREQV
jgi:GT2 family glycosyltransferase